MSKKLVAGILGGLLSLAAIALLNMINGPENISFQAFTTAFVIPLSLAALCAIAAFGCFAYVARG